jgi:hypothetical protein
MSENLFERRRAERRYALNFLEFEIVAEAGDVLGRGLARTLNVSETGLLLETGHFFEAGQQLRITLGLKNDLIQLCGRVMHSEPVDNELCSTGVMFLEFTTEDRNTYSHHFEALKQAAEKT